MIAAMEAVKSGKMGVNMAVLEHGIPTTTLKDRISGKVKHGKITQVTMDKRLSGR